MVAGEDAEAAGVDLQRLVDAELGAEVGDRAGELAIRAACGTSVGTVVEVALELVEEAADVDREVLVGGELAQRSGPTPRSTGIGLR